MSRWPRIVVHADMDAFYAAVEQLDRPELRGKPVLVGHPSPRSVVTTASYEARPFGVGSAMPMVQARRLCPQAIVVPPRFERYTEVSARIMEVFGSFSPVVEALSLDEAFIEMTGAERLFGAPEQMGRAIKRAVKEATGLDVSVGVSSTKYVAKVASDFDKPDGLTVVPPDLASSFLAPLPVRRLWGVGPRTEPSLHALGLTTIGEVARADRAMLVRELGALGDHVWRLANVEDPREVVPDRDNKSVGSEQTLERDVRGRAAIEPHLLHAADKVAHRLRADGLVARGLRVKLKTADFRIQTRQHKLARPTSSADDLYAAAQQLLDAFELDRPFRLVGLAAFDLVEHTAPRQGDLFTGQAEQRRERLDRTLDAVWEKFGAGAITRASELGEEE